MSNPKSSENQSKVLIPEQFLNEIKQLTEELKALQTDETNRYKSFILKEMHEIRQWKFK